MKYFIITGASKGLGEGIALELLDESHHLVCIARGQSKALRQMAKARNCQVDFISFDLAKTHEIPQLCQVVFDKIEQKKASGVYLINNAGVIDPVERIENCPPDQVDNHMQINLLAPMLLSACFIKHTCEWDMQKRILNISSGAARNPYYGWSSYCTAKAGLDMFTRCIATEQQNARFPVQAMGIAPGVIDTGMQSTIRATTEEQFIHRQRFIDLKEKGQLKDPRLAGRNLIAILLSGDFRDGEITDIRDRY